MLNVDKTFLKFLIYTHIKRKMIVLEFEINYEKDFIAKNQKINSEKIREKENLLKEYDHELNTLAKVFYEVSKQDISNINEIILKEWKKILEYLLAKREYCDTNIYTLVSNCGNCNDSEFNSLYKIYYNETLVEGKRNIHHPFNFYNNIICFIRNKEFDFIPILKDIVNYKLYNPNVATGASNEPFWTCFPDPYTLGELSLLSYIEKVVLDERTNYYILRNGSDAVKDLLPASPIYNGIKHLSDKDQFDLNLFSKIIKERNFSVLDTIRLKKENSLIYYNGNCSLLNCLFEDYRNEYETIKDVKEYLLSKKGINEQIIGAKYREPYRNDVIDMYIKLIIQEHGNELEEEIKKLEFLKF